MTRAQIRSGDVWGVPVVKFTMTYEGPLPSAGNSAKPKEAWRIRKDFHPQLVDLWASHPALKMVEESRWFPKTGGATILQGHHDQEGPINELARAQVIGLPKPDKIDLCEAINSHGRLFVPLVRNSFALHAGLKIRFLRREPPGKVYQGGDIDGRIKLLLDALAIPRHKEQVQVDNGQDTTYCLLEDDALISGLEVETERLLGATDKAQDWVNLTIEVDVRVKMARIYNTSFLG